VSWQDAANDIGGTKLPAGQGSLPAIEASITFPDWDYNLQDAVMT
jgi:hypothetical protein